MKTGLTLVELATEIERQAKQKKDLIADTRHLRMASDGQGIVVREEPMGLRPIAHRQIAERVGIPAKYYERMQAEAPQLLADNVNHWFQSKPERRMVRVLGNDVRAFLSDRYQRIDNFDVASVALPILRDVGIVIQSAQVTESRLYIKGTSPNVIAEVKGSKRVGDIVEAGIIIENSEVGLGSVSVAPWYKFLACLNGMKLDRMLSAAHLGRKQEGLEGLLSDSTKKAEDSVVLMKVRDVLKAAMDAARFQAEINKMSEQTQQFIAGDPVKAIELLSDGFLTDGEQSNVLRHLISGGDLSRFGLMNAVTASAEDAPEYDRATQLEAFGGRVLDLPVAEWKEVSEVK